MYGYILKIIQQKSIDKMTHGLIEVWKFLVLTSEQGLVCVEVADRGFILKDAFPKENTFIFLDNI